MFILLIITCSPLVRKADVTWLQRVKPSEEEKERRELFNLLPLAETTKQIQEQIDEVKKFFLER